MRPREPFARETTSFSDLLRDQVVRAAGQLQSRDGEVVESPAGQQPATARSNYCDAEPRRTRPEQEPVQSPS